VVSGWTVGIRHGGRGERLGGVSGTAGVFSGGECLTPQLWLAVSGWIVDVRHGGRWLVVDV
jgi:hypothetical protein